MSVGLSGLIKKLENAPSDEKAMEILMEMNSLQKIALVQAHPRAFGKIYLNEDVVETKFDKDVNDFTLSEILSRLKDINLIRC